MHNINYPRLPAELDKRRILTEQEIAEMRELRELGFSSRVIGEMYAVSKTIVLYWTNDDAYRDKVNKQRYQIIAVREKRDANYKALRREQKKKIQKSVLLRYEPARKYKGKITYKWKKKKRQTDEVFRKHENEEALKRYHKKRKI